MASKKKRSISCSSGAKDEAEHYGFSQELYASAGDHERGSLLEDEDDEEDYYYEQLEEYETRQGFSVRRDHADAHNKIFGTVWCVHDICGIICAVFTWLLVMFAEFVVMRVILFNSTSSNIWYRNINALVWQALAGLALVSHIRTMFTDPGAVERGTATKEIIELMGFRKGQVIYKCQKCCSIKPRRAHHCSVCQRCIKKMDHHCPWVNNCVGEHNQKFFVLFTFYIALTSIHALVLAINHFVICVHGEWKECTTFTPPATVVFLVFLIFEALLFTIFTVIMFATQLQAIWNDETGIEQLKKEETKWTRKSRWLSLQVVFGRFSIGWFNPFTSPSASMKKPHFISFPV